MDIQSLLAVLPREAHDDAEYVGLICRLVVPTERVVSEVDVYPHVMEGFPEVGDLLPLADGVGRDQGAARALSLREPRGLHVPGPAVVDVARVLRAVEDLKEFGLLLLGLVASTQERRVAHKISNIIGEHLGPIGLEGVAKELEEAGFAKESVEKYLKMFEEITPDTAGVEYCREKLEGFLDKEYADGLKTIIDSVNAVKTAEFKIAFDPTLVRGMSYYTGPIFEIAMDEYGGSVGGGGRYDEMIGKFTGNQTCACGFSIGFERIVMLLLERDYQIPGAQKKKAYLIEKNMPAEGMQKIIQQATKERSEGTAINIAVMKKNKKFQKEQLASEGYTEIEEFFVDKM